jgi:DHA1 family tetracycline resistance protein-like MFS transporter
LQGTLTVRKMLRESPLLFLFVTVFVDMIGYGIVVPLLPFYVQQQAPGAVLVGLLGSLYAAMQFVGGPFLGGLSDRAGRRPVLLFCLLGTSLAYLLLGLSDTLLLLVVAVFLAGGAGGTLATAQAYIADSTSVGDRARGLGLIGAAFGLGLIAGPVLGGLLSLYSLGAPAFAASALALCNVAFGFFVLPESLPLMRRTSTPGVATRRLPAEPVLCGALDQLPALQQRALRVGRHLQRLLLRVRRGVRRAHAGRAAREAPAPLRREAAFARRPRADVR